ncbi:glycosyl transferase family 2 protein [Ectocarpus siliculosus]|uniref:Glycosyl transferase family 2 protein n=1 Tax=Ectocarpus siliculosus TaxID=2880 RepID=D8LGV6_ECTSI|nr:glycosyl transferase family 2 protein [Ectocarpus siliculosus]|eukprot:CBN75809.1 glycosyl transferase family 2 protein [Ectocarpus siliculosus]
MLRPVRTEYKPPSPSPLNSPSRLPTGAAAGWPGGRGRGSGSSRGQWWRGALVGAVSALIVCGAGRVLLGGAGGGSGGGGSGGGGSGDTRGLAEEETRNHGERCPVFNAVTGETKVPDDSPPKKIETLIKPGKAYPIKSQDWATRVYAAKSARSQASKGAGPDEIGRAALSKRLAARQLQGPREESGGTAAVLTLLVADAKKPQPFLSALGGRQSWDPEHRATAAAAGAGEAEWAWEEVFVCEEDEGALDGILGSRGEGEAWREALERGAVKLVPCSSGGADERRAGELSLACAAGDASVSEFVWVPGPAVAEALGMADAKRSTPSGRGAEVVARLSRAAAATGVEGVFGVRGWQRTQDAPRPKRQRRGLLVQSGGVVGGEPRRDAPEPAQPDGEPEGETAGGGRRSLLKAFKRTGRDEKPWQFVGGAGAGAETGAGLVEVDALTDALFVRGTHLRHACALLRNAGTSGRAAGRRLGVSSAGDGGEEETSDFVDGQRQEQEEEEAKEREQEQGISPDRRRRRATMAKTTGNEAANSAISFMKLPAVSYVLRKTLGVRSYASSELLPWGGPDGGKVRWSWGGGKGDDNLGSFEASVPGSEFLPWECLSRSGLEPVLLSVTDLRDLRAIKAEIAYVLLPEEDVPNSLWLARLAPTALSSWSRPRFSVSIITNDRPRSLSRLLDSLQRSRLFGDEMAVDFYIESSADDDTLGVAERFSSVWGDRGQVQTHFRVLKGGLIRAVTESFFPSDRDDIGVSPHFYAWGKWAPLTYQYGAPSDFMENMYGVSLSIPRVDELNKKRHVYDSNKLIASIPGGAKYMPYLHQLPCRWKTSWKRFFIEMAYQAQYYMLYPNFFNQTSFATNWLEAGEHIKIDQDKANDGKPAPAAPKVPPHDPVAYL